jgi:hypothetical protein
MQHWWRREFAQVSHNSNLLHLVAITPQCSRFYGAMPHRSAYMCLRPGST